MTRIISGWFAALCLFAALTLAPQRSLGQCCGSEQCSGDFNCDGHVTINEVILAVHNALTGCSQPVGADQACTDAATANCTKLDQCIFNGTTIRYGGASTCHARQKQVCLERLGATGTGNTPNAVELCVSEVPSASCSEFDLGSIPECQAKVGSGANGAPCAFAGQCESANCAIVAGTTCGTCAPSNQIGDPCATTSCSQGLFCVATTQQCQPRGPALSACDTDHPCAASLSCVTPAGMTSGTCQVAGSILGAACDTKRQTAPGCDSNAGLFCDAASNTCHAVSYATAGAQCGFINQAAVACTNASTCFGAHGQTPGTCVADAADGAPCDTQVGPSCVPPAVCVITGGTTATNGVCRFPDSTMCH
jgi:hypothetical protein